MHKRSVRLMGACQVALGAACLGAYKWALFIDYKQNSYLGAYPRVGAYPEYCDSK